MKPSPRSTLSLAYKGISTHIKQFLSIGMVKLLVLMIAMDVAT